MWRVISIAMASAAMQRGPVRGGDPEAGAAAVERGEEYVGVSDDGGWQRNRRTPVARWCPARSGRAPICSERRRKTWRCTSTGGSGMSQAGRSRLGAVAEIADGYDLHVVTSVRLIGAASARARRAGCIEHRTGSHCARPTRRVVGAAWRAPIARLRRQHRESVERTRQGSRPRSEAMVRRAGAPRRRARGGVVRLGSVRATFPRRCAECRRASDRVCPPRKPCASRGFRVMPEEGLEPPTRGL